MFGIAVWLAACSAQDQFPEPLLDVPGKGWFYEGIDRAEQAGFRSLDVFSGNCFGGRRPRSRYELAIATHMTLEAFFKGLDSRPSVATRREFLARNSGLFPFFDRATREFSPELAEFGFTWKDELARLKPFSDIPKGHWAAESVGDLKVLGFISGYPDGKFRG